MFLVSLIALISDYTCTRISVYSHPSSVMYRQSARHASTTHFGTMGGLCCCIVNTLISYSSSWLSSVSKHNCEKQTHSGTWTHIYSKAVTACLLPIYISFCLFPSLLSLSLSVCFLFPSGNRQRELFVCPAVWSPLCSETNPWKYLHCKWFGHYFNRRDKGLIRGHPEAHGLALMRLFGTHPFLTSRISRTRAFVALQIPPEPSWAPSDPFDSVV